MPPKRNLKRGRKSGRTINDELFNQKPDEPPSKKSRSIFPLPVPKRPTVKGTTLVCGVGDVGQLGLGINILRCRHPTILTNVEDAVDICAGGMHTLILTHDGLMYSFGCNDEGTLGRDTSEEDSEYIPGLVDLPGKVVMMSAGDSHTACLLENGTVMAWGSFRNAHGNMGLTVEGNKRLPYDLLPNIQCCSIASGANHLVILTCAGHIYTIGSADQGQLGRISKHSASAETGRRNSAMLLPNEVELRRGQLVDAIWATNYCTFVRTPRTGRIFGFGLNNYNQLAYPKQIDAVYFPVLIDCTDVKTIAGGEKHTMVLKNDGRVQCIGCHHYGRLGLGALSDDITILTPIVGVKEKIVDIACGDATSFAITEIGQLYSWGFGSNLQVGIGKKKKF